MEINAGIQQNVPFLKSKVSICNSQESNLIY